MRLLTSHVREVSISTSILVLILVFSGKAYISCPVDGPHATVWINVPQRPVGSFPACGGRNSH